VTGKLPQTIFQEHYMRTQSISTLSQYKDMKAKGEQLPHLDRVSHLDFLPNSIRKKAI
jgi:hypothetical protein